MNHKQLVQQMAEMQAQLVNYQTELTQLRSQVTSYENVETPIPSTNATSSRRKLLKRMAIAGIGGIGALGLAATTNPNYTVLASPPSADNAIEAVGGPTGYGLQTSGGVAAAYFMPAALNMTIAHQQGEITVDASGNLYYCITAGTPGVWRSLAGPNSTGSSHLLASPQRVVDTLNPGGAGGYNGAITNGTKAFTIAGVSGIPGNATAVFGNVSAFAPNFSSGGSFTSTGALTVFPASADGAAAPAATTLNFSAPQTVISNSFTSGLLNGKVGVFVYQSARVTVDIVGYYL